MIKLIFKNCELAVMPDYTARQYRHMYSVELLDGSWPKDNDLITICDNRCSGEIGSPRHFGGNVCPTNSDKVKKVSVYID